ncbi:triose-phosphate isomerase [Blattabacterium sp. (Mastotermes darwiniensis) str. MADAR]|uniref:triose-phosphate isomerase n=1 Tax=Blattabacterium sp. (Mastotermes darwiniensis) TaxID=39768 RepID=UPI000231DEE7|nr:triose-phosphate isomerase [Blattabacterium sp. (Mastotermes darwiniensis)]AER40795.1 triose-phosphate isomerase [Blattabacterium sp. (Mastotermes darwiniensis) str. MADAR]
MRKKVVIANWKMNQDFYETTSFLRNLLKIIFEINHKKEIIIAPSFPFLHISNQILQGSTLSIAAQNIHQMENGSYTGEVSASMLKSIGVQKVILGHSERRKHFSETNDILIKKIKTALKYKFIIIFCVGETEVERRKKEHFLSVKYQLEETIFHFSLENISSFIIAYEPIWAIGTGKTATPEVVQVMHQYIRSLFMDKYGKNISRKISILYGGSINDLNAKSLFYQKDIDGGLVGNSSLNIEKFMRIIQS